MARMIENEETLKERVVKMLPKRIPASAIDDVEYDRLSSVKREWGGSYWVYLRAGWEFKDTGCHTIHEDNLRDIRVQLYKIVEWPNDPMLKRERGWLCT